MPDPQHTVRIYAPIDAVSVAESGVDVLSRSEYAEVVKDIKLEYGEFTSISATTSTTAADQVLDTVPVARARTIKYIVQASAGSVYHTTEVIIIHDDTTVYMSEFGTDAATTTDNLLALSSDIVNGQLRLLVTPTFENTSYKAIRTIIAP